MKYLFIFFALSFFIFSINDVHALLVSEDPVGEMDVVAVGMIVSAVPGTNSYGVPETRYVADVEEVIKGFDVLEDGIQQMAERLSQQEFEWNVIIVLF